MGLGIFGLGSVALHGIGRRWDLLLRHGRYWVDGLIPRTGWGLDGDTDTDSMRFLLSLAFTGVTDGDTLRYHCFYLSLHVHDTY